MKNWPYLSIYLFYQSKINNISEYLINVYYIFIYSLNNIIFFSQCLLVQRSKSIDESWNVNFKKKNCDFYYQLPLRRSIYNLSINKINLLVWDLDKCSQKKKNLFGPVVSDIFLYIETIRQDRFAAKMMIFARIWFLEKNIKTISK